MTTFLLALGAMLILTAAMSIGVLMGRKPIAGSCGGMSALGMKTACEICGGDTQRCEEEQERRTREDSAKPAQNFHDAMKTRQE